MRAEGIGYPRFVTILESVELKANALSNGRRGAGNWLCTNFTLASVSSFAWGS